MEKSYKKNNTPSHAVDRTFRILECLSQHESLTIDQIAKKTNIPLSTATRFLKTCLQFGYIKMLENKQYQLSTKMFQLAHTHMQIYAPVFAHAHTYLQELCYNTNETIHMGILVGTKIQYIDKIDSPLVLHINSYIGLQVDIHSTSLGKSIVAWLPANVQKALVNNLTFNKRTSKTISSKAQFFKELEKVKKQGFAEDNEENELHLHCIGVPIFDNNNYPCASISASIPTVRFSQSRKQMYKQHMVNHLQKCAATLSKTQGNKNYKASLIQKLKTT